ncbi:MAG: ABC transporter permease subunit [SAR324 cluster bacterium]|nr:ABC transporter permease subunit [SAR324 cluster bacterium]
MAENVSQDEGKTLSHLWRNKESRAVIIQIVTLVVILIFIGLILRNISINLKAIGKDFNFDFLFIPAGYDITFQPILDYSPEDNHLWAGVIGIVNTLLVAISGIILATILGFTLGVLRLSSNWLINKMSYVFLEFTRNVPLLLHILFVHAIITHTLPIPKNAISLNDTFFLTNRAIYLPEPIFESGFWLTAVAFFAAIVFIYYFKIWAKKTQDETGQIYPVFWISVAALFGAPIIIFLVSGSPLSWGIPVLKGFNFKGGLAIRPEFIALWLALSYYTATYIAEIVRGGILAISYGQTEAASALGLRKNRVLQLILIPQTLRIIIPPLTSQYLNLTKNSSLAIAIGYMDVVATIGGISLMQTGKEVETMLIVLLTYLFFSLLISAIMNFFNRKIRFKER